MRKKYFDSFNNNFGTKNLVIELADGAKFEGTAQGQGNGTITLYDSTGKPRSVKLLNTLYIPSFKHNIFSVSAAIKRGASVSFSQNSGEMVANHCIFKFQKINNLYFLNSSARESVSVCRSLEEWHQVMGHCNTSDIFKLQNCTKNMKISNKKSLNCETYVKGKCL